MTIRGSLSEAGLSDVLQLLALGQKTGCLSVARPGDFGSVFFVRGRVVHAALVNRRDRLGQSLVQGGVADEADVRAALAEQAGEPGARLGELLVRRGVVDRATLDRHVRMQVEDAVYTLLGWGDGTFAFEAGVRPEFGGGSVALDPGTLLLEGARRADELTLIATEVPGADSIFAPVAAASDAPELTADQRRVVPLLDGRRDVARLADAAGLGEFDVARALYDLVRRGLARRVGRSAGADVRGSIARIDEHRNLGHAFARAGMLDIAAREFRRVLELEPADARARVALGHLALRERRWAEAAAVLGEAIALPGAPAAAFHALGLARHRLGLLDEAAEALDEAARRGLAADARVAVARATVALARHETRAGRDAARRHLAEARERFSGAPLPALWYHASAALARADGDAAACEGALRAGVAAHPGAAPLHANLAALLAATGRHGEAERHARHAVDADPDLPQAHKALADALYRAGLLQDATDHYRRAVQEAPALGPEAWVRLGTLALRGGDREGAIAAWQRAVALEPAHAIARANLASLLQEAGR
jgi:tetratricopeptide (TPR) repeat protein